MALCRSKQISVTRQLGVMDLNTIITSKSEVKQKSDIKVNCEF